ncbi:hypothetical protein SAMN04489832_3283 [Micromonospora cremea]|uniref:Uncharacterized protein n=2 Tax=Micromonospora cremea TaxID=709881 RepID=A0A1N5YUD8_9ACTN|nr:hypothetical protein SAMN04489832_3283 [Micromonospora cremea]
MTTWPAAAALWALAYGLLALYWSAGGAGFPFGAADPDPGIDKGMSILGGAHQASAAPVIAVCAMAATVLAGLLAVRTWPGRAGAALEAIAWAVALVLGIVLPDYRPLVAVGHLPVLLAGKPFGWPEDVTIASQVPWPVVNQFICILGGILFAVAALAHRRTRTGACAACGHSGRDHDPARWGAVAVWIAAGVPVLYATTRWAWALGVPFGFSAAELRQMDQELPGIWWVGAAMGSMGLIGSVLTVGLIRPWGEAFPRWIPVLRGRRVPVALAVVPAMAVAMLVTSAGLMFARALYVNPSMGNWAAMGPSLLWPVWGAALAVAAVAYRLRRQTPCARCGDSQSGRGTAPHLPLSSGARAASHNPASAHPGHARHRP